MALQAGRTFRRHRPFSKIFGRRAGTSETKWSEEDGWMWGLCGADSVWLLPASCRGADADSVFDLRLRAVAVSKKIEANDAMTLL